MITLQPPGRLKAKSAVLHNRVGGATKDLKQLYDADTTPALAQFVGEACHGTWTLKIQDQAARDVGTLVSFAVGLSFAHSDRVPPPRVRKARKKKAKK